jgi:hypothetical protein
MTVTPLSPAVRQHVRVALLAYARQLHRDGVTPPPELFSFADEIVNGEITWRDAYRHDPAVRAKILAAERTRRWRARKRGEDVPYRQPGQDRQAAC